jgi:hypothetical protein
MSSLALIGHGDGLLSTVDVVEVESPRLAAGLRWPKKRNLSLNIKTL